MQLMTVSLLIVTALSISLHSCPTCIGLPRPSERPFFERKAFLSIAQQTTSKSTTQKNLSIKPLNTSIPTFK